MNQQNLQQFVDGIWDKSIVPTLIDYIKIPNKSPVFDPKWAAHGYMDQAVELMSNWCHEQAMSGMQLEVVRLENRTPLIFIEIPGTQDATVLLYGHLDKQPEMVGWHEELGPWKPVLKGDRLYGRGSGDDGYAIFSACSAILALQKQNIPHPRCVILIEACEESGSYDLPFYIDHLKDRLGTPDLVICLDSWCANYDQLWCTTSLRGLVNGELTIEVLTQGVHSGSVGGVVPSATLVLRQLLARLEDEETGRILPQALHVDIPEDRRQQARVAAEMLKDKFAALFPLKKNLRLLNNDLSEIILNRTWRAALTVTGAEGFPALENAGNVMLPYLKLMLSLRIPPTCDATQAAKVIKQLLETDPPFNAKVEFNYHASGTGWNSPALDKKLAQSIEQASQTYFNKPAAFIGEGGTIPFMGMLGEKFPQAQFVITGVLGPESNAHGPNEFLHIPTAKKVTCCVAQILAEMKK
jgi:acetylornithine deacetylase/succinyl-diaminopimelate desuccinylase-like protein